MPNSIKYSTTGDTQSLRDGNFYIGTGDVGKGPTSSTGHWNGITPPSGGYTVYKNKVSNGPAIWTATTDNQLISITNNIEGTSFTSVTQCFTYYANQTDRMVFNIDYEGIITNGLVLNLDAGFLPSYPTSGTTWYDLSYSGNNSNLINGTTFVQSGGGSIVFDGTDDYANFTFPNNLITPTFTVCSVITPIAVAGNGTVVFTNESARLNLGIAYGGNNGGYFFVAGNNGQSINGVFGSYGFSYGTNTKYFATWIVDIPGKNFQFWVNGSLVGSSNADLGTNFSNTSTNGFVLASRYGGGSSRVNIGISNFQFYNRVLTSNEIVNNYNVYKSRFGI
jgi:hypothetical protein